MPKAKTPRTIKPKAEKKVLQMPEASNGNGSNLPALELEWRFECVLTKFTPNAVIPMAAKRKIGSRPNAKCWPAMGTARKQLKKSNARNSDLQAGTSFCIGKDGEACLDDWRCRRGMKQVPGQGAPFVHPCRFAYAGASLKK